jgi:hypothetical protein
VLELAAAQGFESELARERIVHVSLDMSRA